MDQLICASLSHTHYWYEVGMLKVPVVCYIDSGKYIFAKGGEVNSTIFV